MHDQRRIEEELCIHCTGPLEEGSYRNSAGLRLCAFCRDTVFEGISRTWIAPEDGAATGFRTLALSGARAISDR